MKFFAIGVAKAKLSEVIGISQRDHVIVTNHGRPVAIIIGIDGIGLDTLEAADGETLQRLIKEHWDKRAAKPNK